MLKAIWLHLRGDGLTIGRMGRNFVKEQVNSKLARMKRNFEPSVYMETLDLLKLKKDHHLFYESVYGENSPCPLSGEEKAAILQLDSLMSCRGGGTETIATTHAMQPPEPQALQLQPVPQAMQLQPQSPLTMQSVVMLLHNLLCNGTNNGSDIGLQLLGGQPQGRPMRSRDNLRSSPHTRALSLHDSELSRDTGDPNDDIDNVAKKCF